MVQIKSKAKGAKITTFGLSSKRKGDPDTHGGKGSGLINMSREGLPVPPGFVIHTTECLAYRKDPGATMKRIKTGLVQALKRVHAETKASPQVFSVRSGAKFSMPGMMDTILNVGSCSDAKGGAKLSPTLLMDCQRRFFQMYGEVVKGIPADWFEMQLAGARELDGVETDSQLTKKTKTWIHKTFYAKLSTKTTYPADVVTQLLQCIEAVFKSWDNPRAQTYRELNEIPHDLGTAVVIQLMVYGNQPNSGSGVVFSMNPSTGENSPVGEYLENAQGEEVVSGVRDPKNIHELGKPKWLFTLLDHLGTLEEMYRDMVDVEFTVEKGKLWILQCRAGKRTGGAAFKIAHTFWENGAEVEEVLSLVSAKHYAATKLSTFVGEVTMPNEGKPASPGVAFGLPCTTESAAADCIQKSKPFVWIAHETNPNHIKIMSMAQGIITEVGGITSHAAVVARGMNKPCITASAGAVGKAIHGWVTMDGASGKWGVQKNEPEIVTGQVTPLIQEIMTMAYAAKGGIPEITLWAGGPAWINAGRWMTDPKGGDSGLTLTNLANSKGEDLKGVVLDLSIPQAPKEDEILSSMFVDDENKDASRRRVKLIQWLMGNKIAGLSIDGVPEPQYRKALENSGYAMIHEVRTLKEALEPGPYVKLSGGLMKVLGFTVPELVEQFPAVNLVPQRMTPDQALD